MFVDLIWAHLLDTELKHYSFYTGFFFSLPFSFFGANSLPANSAIIPTKINSYGEGDARQREPMGTLQTGVYYSEFLSAGRRQKEWGCFKEAKTLNGGAVTTRVIFIGGYSKPLGSGTLKKSTTPCKKTNQSGFDIQVFMKLLIGIHLKNWKYNTCSSFSLTEAINGTLAILTQLL